MLDHQLVNLRMYNMDPRTPSHDIAWLRSTNSFEKVGNSMRSDEILKTGQIPKTENAMPRLILDESEDEGVKVSGDVNAWQAWVVFLARKPVIRREIASPTKTGRRRIQTGRQEIWTRNQFSSITVDKKAIYHMIEEVSGRTQVREMNSKIQGVDKQQKWQNSWWIWKRCSRR